MTSEKLRSVSAIGVYRGEIQNHRSVMENLVARTLRGLRDRDWGKEGGRRGQNRHALRIFGWPQRSPTFGPPQQSHHGEFRKIGNSWAEAFLWFVPECPASRKFRSPHVLQKRVFDDPPSSSLIAVPEMYRHGYYFWVSIFWFSLGARQRSSEGVVRRNGCAKGCFWRVRFFSAPLRFSGPFRCLKRKP